MEQRFLRFRWVLATLAAWLWLGVSASVAAAEAQPTAADPVLEQRVNALSAELRCLVCQNQSVADSQAGLAVDLKNQVREQLKAGRTDRQVIDYMTERYGDFVLYRPPIKTTTVLLWGGPLLLLLGGGVLLWRAVNANTRARDPSPLEPEAVDRLAQMLEPSTAASSQAAESRSSEATSPVVAVGTPAADSPASGTTRI